MKAVNILKNESRVMVSYPQVGVLSAGMAEYTKLATQELMRSEVEKITLVGDDLKLDHEERIEPITIEQYKIRHWTIIMSLAILFRGHFFAFPFRPFLKLARTSDCVYVPHSFFGASVFLKHLLKKTEAAKVVWTLHDPVRHEERKSRLFLFLKRLEYKQILQLCARYKNRLFIHVHSERLIDNTQWEGLENMVCWQHPLPERIISETPPEEEIVIGFVGRIEPYKGLDMMLNAIADFQSSFKKKVKILVMGKGHFNNDTLDLIHHPCEVHNRFLEKEEFHEGIARMDCVVLPYLTATQSGIGFLALTYEKPVIATNVGALSEIVELSENPFSSLCLPTEESLGQALVKFVNHFSK